MNASRARTLALAGLAALSLGGGASAQEPKKDEPSVSAGFPIKFTGSLTVRQDFTKLEDDNDLLLGDDRVDGLRARIRFGVEANNPDAIVGGGLRFTVGSSPNPASPFIRLGAALLPSNFGLDRYYIQVRPLKSRDRLVFTAGKMGLPIYRPGAGTWRSEMIWDDDVSPAGANLQAILHKGGSAEAPVRLENNLAYLVFEDITNNRFEGFTGTAYMAGDQLRLSVKKLDLAAGYFHYTNLNVGMRAPNFTPGQGAFPLPGRNPFLRGPGLQNTNNALNYGPGADGFANDDFKIFNAAATLRLRVLGDRFGKPEVFVAGDYTHNSGVDLDRQGVAVSVGVTGGGWSGAFHPYTIHATYRDVDADGVLATFADSDLGAGSSYKGFEIGANYRISRNLLALSQYFDFDGFPRKDRRVRRLFLDLIWDF